MQKCKAGERRTNTTKSQADKLTTTRVKTVAQLLLLELPVATFVPTTVCFIDENGERLSDKAENLLSGADVSVKRPILTIRHNQISERINRIISGIQNNEQNAELVRRATR